MKTVFPPIVYLGVIPRGKLWNQEYKHFHETIQNALWLSHTMYTLWFCCLVTESCLIPSCRRGLQPAKLLCPRGFPGRNPGVASRFLLQGIQPAPLASPTLAGGFLTTEPPGKPVLHGRWFFSVSLPPQGDGRCTLTEDALLYVLASSLARPWWHCWAFLYKRNVFMVYFKRIMKHDKRKWRPMGSQYLLSWVLAFCCMWLISCMWPWVSYLTSLCLSLSSEERR